MKNKLYYQPLYFIFWVLYFVAARAVFLIYHLDKTSDLTTSDTWSVFLFGLRLDASATAYLCLLPFLALLLSALWPRLRLSGFVRVYTYIMLVLLSLLLSADLELYTYWGFRLDATPLQYLNTPAEMAASAAAAPIFLLLFVTLCITTAFILLYRWLFDFRRFVLKQNKWLYAGLSLWYLAFLILPLRGGWQQIPINQSVAYFSSKPFANHAGLNMPWNLVNAVLKQNKIKEDLYGYMPPAEAVRRVQALYAAVDTSASKQVVVAERPNVLFIILESYTAKFIGSLGGEEGVTPHLDSLAAEGISFTNLYASGDRSEKGMVALLSGYPVQTTTSIIKYPQKTEKLPQLSTVLQQQGYSTSFYYGGELEFANIRSYLTNGGYDRLIAKDDFAPETYNSKWGAHDHVLFGRVLQDLEQEKQPFFSTVYTLSSHEPYEIPVAPRFAGEDDETKFRNSVYYTDWALGRFIAQAKQQPWWENTLVVITADHGHPLPGNDPNFAPSKFHIPLILTGGAIPESDTVSTIASQTDIAATLLALLNLSHQNFKWSRNLFAPTSSPFAFYVFNDGFGYITPNGAFTFDNVGKQIISRDAGVTEEQVLNGKAYMQRSFEDFVQK
ncbi:LTA synthase family protein [Pontibacter russatus]|uniref:LTA synthase family protein n=1 Tax=Pontibacter russatus TaxID=2694929 RepID=UPI00137AB413|nr:LTA synthase family protein [Pontibacter russatus]